MVFIGLFNPDIKWMKYFVWYMTLHGKPYFLFLDILKRWSFKKKSRWNMIFVVLLWKIMFLFPENIILHPRRKMIFLVLSGKMVFFAENTIFFLWAGSQRWPFSRNTCKYDIFCVHVWVSQTWCHAPLPKKKIKDRLIPQEYT